MRVRERCQELRYLVIPQRPAGTDGWSEERLATLEGGRQTTVQATSTQPLPQGTSLAITQPSAGNLAVTVQQAIASSVAASRVNMRLRSQRLPSMFRTIATFVSAYASSCG